jgi:hypothetical protein
MILPCFFRLNFSICSQRRGIVGNLGTARAVVPWNEQNPNRVIQILLLLALVGMLITLTEPRTGKGDLLGAYIFRELSGA